MPVIFGNASADLTASENGQLVPNPNTIVRHGVSQDIAFTPSQSATITHIGLNTSSTNSVNLAILDVNGNVIGQTGAVQATGSGDAEYELLDPVSVDAGQTYYLAIWSDGYLTGLRESATFSYLRVQALTFAASYPTAFSPSSTSNSKRIALWAIGNSGPSITTADDVTTEGQTATFTLAGNTGAPVSAALNGTDVGTLTLVSGSTYSYTAPLLLDDDTASLVVTVDGTTASTTISYANSYPYVLTQHGTPNVNSIFKDTQFASNDPVEWGVVTDYDSGIVTVNHAAMDAAEDELNDVALHSTEVSEGTTTATYKYFVQESGATGTWQATIVVSEEGDNGGDPVDPVIPVPGGSQDKGVRLPLRAKMGKTSLRVRL